MRERHPGAHALDGLEQAEPAALGRGRKPIERDAVVAHLGLDQQIDRLAGRGSAASVRVGHATR